MATEELPILKSILKGNVNYHNAPVRFGRVPKREKARILAAMQQSTQNRGQQRALANELDDQPRLLAAVLRAHLDTCEFTKEKVLDMRQRARECPSFSMPTLLACPLNPAPELQSEQEFSQRFAHIIRGVIDFAGMIPGFQLLTQDDKFTLLKAGLFDALFVRLICMFDSSINSIICLNGQVMRRDAIQNGANARFLVDSTFNFAERMNSMNLSDAEIGLFCAIVLITPDRPGLRNIELIEKMYSRLKGCLQTIIQQNRPDQPDFMAKLLDTLPDLRTLSTLHTEKLVVFRTEHKEMLRQQMWTMDEVEPRSSSMSPPASVHSNEGTNSGGWLQQQERIELMSVNKSPVSSTECGDPASSFVTQKPQPASSLASSAPLLAATLSGSSNCPLRQRANSGSSGDSSAADFDMIVGPHAHLTQNGLTITPIARPTTSQQQQQQQQHQQQHQQHQQQQQQQQQLHHHLTSTATVNRYRKLDSPTDSGIESGNEKNECTVGSKPVSSGGSSSCSSPRSSVDDALDCTDASAAAGHCAQSNAGVATTSFTIPTVACSQSSTVTPASSLKRQIVDDMPVLKRVLQAPPLYDTNSLMDEAYKPHKKFRALRHREFESAEADASSSTSTSTSTSSSSAVVATTHSTPVTQTPGPTSGASSPQPANTMVGSQLHMHLTRPPPKQSTTTSSSSTTSSSAASCSLLSSTHSVLAKSLLAEPRMTPEQMKRSDIIQNYIMRDSAPSSSTTPTGPGSRSPAPPPAVPSPQQTRHVITPTNRSMTSPPPPLPATTTRWSQAPTAATVITTTTSRQQSLSPGVANSTLHHHHQYFQSPHSTSSSSSSSSSSPPHLLELQVDIADSQQPLNLSKKSPTPPPNKLQALVAAATVVQQQQQQQQQQHRYPTVSGDVNTSKNSTPANGNSTSNSVLQQQHKVLLEA